MISDPWIDRSYLYEHLRVLHPRPRARGPFKTDEAARMLTTNRRATLRDLGKCINGPMVGDVGRKGVVHGPIYRDDRCERCWRVKRGLPPLETAAADQPISSAALAA